MEPTATDTRSFFRVSTGLDSRYLAGSRSSIATQIPQSGIDALAWATSNRRATIHRDGIMRRDGTCTAGTGIELDLQARHEMMLAARAAIIGCIADGHALDSDETRAARNRAASSELHHATRERIFDDADIASRANDIAMQRWRSENLAQGCETAENASIRQSAENDTRSEVARKLRVAKRAVRNHWVASGSRKWRAGWRADSKLLRELASEFAAREFRAIERGSTRERRVYALVKLLSLPMACSGLAQDMSALSALSARE